MGVNAAGATSKKLGRHLAVAENRSPKPWDAFVPLETTLTTPPSSTVVGRERVGDDAELLDRPTPSVLSAAVTWPGPVPPNVGASIS